eukprot:tig00000741_g3840.t1
MGLGRRASVGTLAGSITSTQIPRRPRLNDLAEEFDLSSKLKTLELQRVKRVLVGQYDDAAALRHQAAELRTTVKVATKEDGLARQEREKKRVERDEAQLRQTFQAEWAEKFREFEMQCEQRLEELKESQARERAEAERTVGSRRIGPPKWSPQILAMIDLEKKLADQHYYGEAKEVRRRLELAMEAEGAKHEARDKGQIERFWRNLDKKHEDEQKNMLRRNLTLRKKVVQERDWALEQLEKRVASIRQGLEHVHRIEAQALDNDMLRETLAAASRTRTLAATARAAGSSRGATGSSRGATGSLSTTLPRLGTR